MDLPKLTPGLTGTKSLVVGPEHTAIRVGSGRMDILATPVLVTICEAASLVACDGAMPEGLASLGVHVDVRHIAPTPVGMRVTATARLVAVEDRLLTFRLEARDEKETIGQGTHQRVIVDVERFTARIQKKLMSSG